MYKDARLLGGGKAGALIDGLKATGKAGGFLRAAGVFGGIYSTVYSAVNVYKQGDAGAHFGNREDGAAYVADWAELGFNASSTLAMVAPNPYTIGATVVTGATWAGSKVVQHWDGIKKGAHATRDWVKDKVPQEVSKIAGGFGALADPGNILKLR
ncbi:MULTISPECIES: hypothetical protein [unclassified Streptomyces]|uniref:hypothetical protein n=1 Tax=unclassified Streptomyces TaxID=2593676 RepID=UPI002E20AC52|nr:hypothetical protein OG217_15830 [Streptomyces sp. NBC_01023]